MRGDNVLAKVCRCASGMDLHEMRLSRYFWRANGTVRYPQGEKLPETVCIHSVPSPPGWGGGHVFLIKQPAAPLQHVFANDFPAPLR